MATHDFYFINFLQLHKTIHIKHLEFIIHYIGIDIDHREQYK